jgi:hypothetical protein
MDNPQALERHGDEVRAVYTKLYKHNVSLTKAFEMAGVASSTFYLVPEDERLVIADEVRAIVEKERAENEEAQKLARQQMLLDLRRDFTDAARDALATLRDVMDNAQSDFVREKAAVDILNFVERNFEGEVRRQADDDTPQLPAPTVNVMLPIVAMPSPAQLAPVSSFTVIRSDGSTKAVGEAPLAGEFSQIESSEK